MKALLLRDFRAYKVFFFLLLVVMLLYSALIFKVGSVNGLVGFLLVFIPPIAGVVLFVGDHELIEHMASLPVSRTEMVMGKYLSTYLFGGALVAITVAITWWFGGQYPNARIDFLQLISLRGFAFSILPVTLIVSVSYPLLFRFGLRWGVRILLVCFALLYGIGSVALERLVQRSLLVQHGGIFAAAMALFREGENSFGRTGFYGVFYSALLVLVTGSILLSVHWIKKKDF